MADIVNVGFRVDTSQIEKGYSRFNKMGSAATAAEKKTSSALGSIGKSAGQAGIQIQQFVGQVQMGTSPLVAMSQQAADLGIVLGAPLLGAITGIAASIGTVLLPSLFDADDATDKLKETLEAIDKVAVQTAGGTFTLTEEIARLAKVSETAANAQIALSITEATQAINLARDSASDAVSELDSLFNGFDVVSTPEMMDKLSAAMERTGLSASELLKTTNLYSTGLTQLRSFSESLNESLGTTTEQSIQLVRAVSDFKSGGSVSDLAKTFSEISLNTNGATKEFQSLAVQLNSLSLTTEKSESVLTLLKEVMGDLDGILNNSESAVNDIINSFKMKTEALHADEVQMAKNIAMQAAGADVTDTERAKIESAIDAYYRKLNAIRAEEKAQREARVEREKAAREAEREAEAIQRAIDKQAQAYARWIAQVENAVDPTKALKEEIDDLWLAMFSDDIDWEVGEKAIENIQKKLDDLTAKDTAKDFNDLFNEVGDGAVSALSSIQDLSAQGSDEYKRLGMAIQAVNTIMAVQSALVSASTGNIIGVVSAAAGFLGSLGGDDFDNISVDIQANQNLNIWGEKADSIDKSMSITAGATKDLVGINTKMLDAMTTLNNSMLAAAGIVSRDVKFGSIDMSGSIIENPLAPITGLFNGLTFGLFDALTIGIFDFLGGFLGGSSKVVDQGIQIIGGSLGELMDEVTVEAFQTVSYKKWKFGSTKQKHNFTDISDQVGEQVSLVFGSIADAVFAGGEILGFSEDYLTEAIQNFQVGFEKISLMGLSAEEQQAEIDAYFSQVFDDLAENVIDFLPDLQQAGEGLGETLSRVAAQVSIADVMVERFGVMFGDKMADPEVFAKAADNIATLVGGVENLAELTSSFTDAFATDQQKFDIHQSALVDQLTEVGLSLPDSTSGFYDLMNGIDATTEAGQQQIATLLGLTDTASQYYELLKKKEEERASLESQFAQIIGDTDYLREQELAALDESNRALQEKIWAYEDEQKALEEINAIQAEQESLLARLANTLGDTTYAREKELEGIDESNKGLLEYIYALEDANKAFDDARTVLDSALSGLSQSIEAEKESINSTHQEMIDAIKSQSEEAKDKVSNLESLISSLSSAFDSVSDSISGVTLSSRQNAQKMLETQLEIAKASGQAPDASLIEGALSTISKPSEDLYSDFTGFARDQAIAANTINDLLGVTDDQLTDAEKQLAALDSQLEISEEWYEAEIERLDKLYASYEKQYNAIIGVDDSVLSVKDATLDLKKVMEDYAKAEADRQDLINQSQEGGSVYNAIVEMNKELASMQEAQLDLLASIESNIKRMRLIDEGLTVA